MTIKRIVNVNTHGIAYCIGRVNEHNAVVVKFDDIAGSNNYLQLHKNGVDYTPIPIPMNQWTPTNTYTMNENQAEGKGFSYKAQIMEKVNGEFIALSNVFELYLEESIGTNPIEKEEVPPAFQSLLEIGIANLNNAKADAKKSAESASSALKAQTAIEQTKTDVDNLAKASATSAGSASASASSASTSAGNASASASNAAGSASAASSASTAAKEFANNASTSAGAAKTSETNASKSATTAGEKAGEALASAGQSATSAGQAKTSETNAKTSEVNAKKYADQCNLKVALPIENGQPVHGQAGDYAISDGRGGIVFIPRKDLTNWEEVRGFVRSGIAKDRYEIGYQFNVPITYNGKTYQVPFHVASYRDIITETGETKPAMILQPHLLLPMSIQFDEPEAFYEAEGSELPAGTYHVTFKDKWGDYVAAGDTYSFTLTKPVPVGGQICGFKHAPYSGVTMKVYVYADAYSTEASETAVLTKETAGTKLGEFTSKIGECNSDGKLCYGYNRWANSFVRQYLNSRGTGWWKKQNKYDRPGSGAASMIGFLDCVDKEFLSVLGPVKVSTAQNTVTETGATDVTYDTFFLPSLEEMSINPQISGVEGPVLDYWNQVSGGQKFPWYKDTPELVQLSVEDNRAKYVWLRSAIRNYSSYVWYIFPSGYVHNFDATTARCLAPLCAIY